MVRSRPTRPTDVSPLTLDRRTVIQWLGKASVLTLGADLIAACSAAEKELSAADGAPSDTHRADAVIPGDLAKPGVCDRTSEDFSLSPPEQEQENAIFASWPVRTVDLPDLTKIMAGWKLTVDGLVNQPRVYSFSELLTLPCQNQVTDLHCVEGWSVLDIPWVGVHLSTLLQQVEAWEGATHVTFHTLGGAYNESLPLEVALEPLTLLTYGVAGATIPLRHGFPLRLVVPRLLGYKNAKFVQGIELTDKPIEGFWVSAGYSYDGEVHEGRLRPGKY